ncbi:MAG: flagellin, partial [Gallionella sp.]|nr:flagellin [Gallionella sp.]
VDIFQVLLDFKTALENNDTANIQLAIDGIKEASGQITQSIAKVGARMQRLDLAKEHMETLNFDIMKVMSVTEDVDMADLITRFTSNEAALKASYQIAARIGNVSLMDFIR